MEIESESESSKHLKRFQLIESNSEFMTVVRRSLTEESCKHLELANLYIEKNQETRIDYSNFIQSFVQIAYLIYSGKYYGLNPLIDLKDVRVEENYLWGIEKRFSVVVYYRFSDSVRDANTYSIIVKEIYKYLIQLYTDYEAVIKPNSQMDVDYKAVIENFVQQVNVIDSKIEELDEIRRENLFFFMLEETDMFKEHSILLKIKNLSMLDHIRLKLGQFKNYKEKDVGLVNEYNNEKKKMKCEIEELKKKEKLIEKNIIEFFEDITKSSSKFKFKVEPDQNFKTKFIFIAQEFPEEPFPARLSRFGNSAESSMQVENQTPANSKVPYMEYQIEYHSEKNSICVRLVMSSIASNSENLDFLMFQSNVLTFESANISLEFVDDKSSDKNQANGKRNLAFRGSSCFNNKEPILEKILILMDLTMIAAKIYEPELINMRKSFMLDRDPQRLVKVYQKVNHYTKVFLKCSKKVYNE